VFYKVLKLAQQETRQLLIVLDNNETPMLTVYDEHQGQTLLRLCEPTIENLTWAVNILRDGE
jgi:hypothetical protein